MANFILIPGAWLGGWCWEKVLPFLEPHTVLTPSLTGLDAKKTSTQGQITVTTHIKDLVEVFIQSDLNDVILVGHSYSGFVITGAADQVSERIKHLVYLDANVPQGEEAFFDAWSENGRNIVRTDAKNAGTPDLWPIPEDVLDTFSEENRKWVKGNAKSHPIGTFEETVRFDQEIWQSIPKTYILCENGQSSLPNYVEHAKISPDWGFETIASHHWPMFSKPNELANVLIKIAAGPHKASEK
ncbi:MAG: alpha/beta hydrolase [Chloroflexota bacterium]